MSRYCGDMVTKPILDAASHWRDAALLEGNSVFTSEPIWTAAHLEGLREYFVGQPNLGDGAFLQKLQKQLADAPSGCKKLAAEMMWLLYLCPSNITVGHKRNVVESIWTWSSEPFPQSPLVADQVLKGIGSGGPGFNQNQWRELAFLINCAHQFRQLSKDEAKRLVGDPQEFDEWLKNIPEWESRQFRHMLLFLLFPDHFERIFGQRDRRTVVQVFGGVDVSKVNAMDPVQLDRALSETRQRLEAEYKTTNLDFYVPPLRERWKQSDFSTVSSAISAEHVRMALAEIDRDGTPASAQSTGYDLIEAGRRYPPKLVFSIAVKYATGQEFDRKSFSGGVDSQAFKVLEKLGFEIASKDLITPLVTRFLDQAKQATDLAVRGYLEEYRGLKVTVSFGKGNFARIPWIAFLAQGQTVSNGIYPVLLLFKDANVLLLCYGLSETNVPESSWEDVTRDLDSVDSWFQSKLGRKPERYGESFVRKAYDLAGELSIEELRQELDLLIDDYEEALALVPAHALPSHVEPESLRPDVKASCSLFSEALRGAGVDFGRRHNELVASFIAAILTKPLVILTGLSGSGKTQIAVRFGEWLGPGRLHVAAVRPDWTGAEALFGYEDGLRPAVDGRCAWAVPAPLEFMLNAASDPVNPYLLLLDEMNLAHVERYFADVLSGMESGQPCLPNLIKGGDGIWRMRPGGPDRISFPRNVWIVGTVNVDETTYMFSPKVLDRANTIEFRVGAEDISGSWRKPRRCEPGDPTLVRGLLSISRDDEWHVANACPFNSEIVDRLRQLHSVLGRYGMEFGHRVFYEAIRFSALAYSAGLASLEEVLDRIVLQKIQPRLHGSRRRIETPILALLHYCSELPANVASDEQLQTMELDGPGLGSSKLPQSMQKLWRLLRSLRANQFASFTD